MNFETFMDQKDALISKGSDKNPLYFDKTSSPRTKIATYILHGLTIVSLLVILIIAIIKIIITPNTGYKYLFLFSSLLVFSHMAGFIFLMHRYRHLPKDTVWYIFLFQSLTIVQSVSSGVVIILD